MSIERIEAIRSETYRRSTFLTLLRPSTHVNPHHRIQALAHEAREIRDTMTGEKDVCNGHDFPRYIQQLVSANNMFKSLDSNAAYTAILFTVVAGREIGDEELVPLFVNDIYETLQQMELIGTRIGQREEVKKYLLAGIKPKERQTQIIPAPREPQPSQDSETTDVPPVFAEFLKTLDL